MKTLIGLLFTLFAIQAAGYNFYISNYKVYSSSEEAYFTYYNYYYHRNDMVEKNTKFVLYRVANSKDFFTSGSLFRYGNLLSDSLMETLTVVKQWDLNVKQTYSSQESLGKLSEGVYILEGINGSEMAQIPIIISDYSLIVRNTGEKAVTYMSNRETGEMVKGYKSYAFVNNENIEPLYYKNATAIFDLNEMGNNYYYNIPMVTVKGNKVAVSQSYFYNYYYNQTDPDQVGYIFTDRSAYRPEQVVKFKGVFRHKDGFGYKVETDSIVYTIYNEQHEEVARKKVALDKSGTFNDSVSIDKSWKLGEYTISYNPGTNNYYYWYGAQNSKDCKFRIEEYKKPEFEVGVTLDKSQYSTGDHIKASVSADYFFGAPVTNATVTYKVVAEPFYVPWYYNYRYYWWYEDLYGSQYYYGGQQVVHQGTGSLNKDGKLEIDYQTDEKKKENYRYTVIAEVTDASRRAISGSSDAIVAYTSFTLSANTQKYYYETTEGIRLELSTLDYSRQRVDESVRVKLYRYTYDHHTWRRGREVQVVDTTVNTSKAMATIFDLPKQEPGHYNVVLEAEDSRGHKISQSVSAYVIDPNNKNYYWWTAGNYGSIRIMTDKKVYNAGETVNAIIYVPHSTDALITVNNKEFAHFDSYTLSGDNNGAFRSISVPIDQDAYGRMEIFVAYNHKNQYYSYKEDISIIPDNKYLNVDIQFDETEYQPGNTATALVKVTDHKGRPVANADVTLSTADEAIYSLYPDLNKDITKVFYNTEVQSYQYNYQNQYSVSASSRRMPIRGIEWRRKKLTMDFDKISYIGKNQWYYYAYQTSISDDPIIRGYVVDYKSGEVLRNASVEIGKHTFRTDNNGYYELRGFKMSHTTITFVNNGHKTSVVNLPLHLKNDVDLVVAVSDKEDKDITMATNPTITAIDNVNRELNSNELMVMEDAVATESISLAGNGATVANFSATSTGGSRRAMSKAESVTAAPAIDELADKDVDMPLQEGGKMKALVEPPKTRSDFQDAIYWNPKLKTDAQGYVKVRIKLPDNLTTWRTSAKVITNRTEIGQTMAKTVVTKNLLVRMETPRFMTLGDELLIATTVHNYLSSDKEVTVELQANGLSVEGTRKTIHVEANDDKSIDWKVNTRYILDDAKLTVKALTDEESDAMEIKLPVQPYGLEMVVGSSLYLTNNDKKAMTFTIPDGVNMNTATLELSTAPSVTAALLSSMDDLIGYPYGCVEQTMSRFLPNVIVAQTIQNLGKDYTSTIDKEELKKMVAQGVKRLGELQHNDGGWGWWENDNTNPFMTAYVVNGLYMGHNAGYDIPADMLNKGKQALAAIIRGKSFDNPTTQAYDMMVAAKVGLTDLWKYASTPKEGNSYEYALWIQAAHYAKDKEMITKLIPKLEEQAIKAGTSVQWGGKKFYYSWQDDQVETTANAILALSLADEGNEYIPGAVNWIMSQRKGNSWHNTRQTAMTIFGLSNIIKNDANPDLELEIFANGVLIDKVHYTAADVFNKGKSYTIKPAMLLASMDPGKQEKLTLLNPSKNEIRVVQKGRGSLFVNGKLRYFLDGNSNDIKTEQKNMSFNVERTYYKLVSKEKNGVHVYYKEKIDLGNVHSGDNILVKVKIHAKSANEYVLIEDPIPAGCEFIRDPKGYVIDGESVYDGTGNYWNYRYWGYWNWNRWYSHREYRDSKISHTVTNLSTGDYEYSYLMKAQIPGNYKVNPCIAQLMYYPENRGFSSFETFSIHE